jgi:hypothetical protein
MRVESLMVLPGAYRINYMVKKRHERSEPRATDYVRRRRWIRTRRRVSSMCAALKESGGGLCNNAADSDSSAGPHGDDDDVGGDENGAIFRGDEAVGVLRSSYQEPELPDDGPTSSTNNDSSEAEEPTNVPSSLSSTSLEIFTRAMDKAAVDTAWSAADAVMESLHQATKSRATQRRKKWTIKKAKIHRQISLLEKTIASMEAVAAEEQKRRRSSASAHTSPQRRSSFLKSPLSTRSAKTPLSPDSKAFTNSPRSGSGLNTSGGAINLSSKLRRAQAKLVALTRLYWHPREKDYTLRFSVDGIFYGLRDFSVESFTSSFSVQMTHQTNGALGITPTCKVIMKGHTVCCGKHVKVVGEKGTRIPKSIWDAMYLDTDFEATIYLIFVEDPDDPKALHRGNWEFLFAPEATKVELINFTRRVKGGMDLPEPIVRKLCSDVLSSLVRDLTLLYFPNELAIMFDAPPSKLDLQGEIEICGPRIDDVMENPLEEIDVEKEVRRTNSNEPKGLLGAAAAQLLSLIQSEKRMREIARLLHLSFGQFNLLVALKDRVEFPSGHSFNTVSSMCDYYKAFLASESADYNEEHVQKLLDTWKQLVELTYIRQQQRVAPIREPSPRSGGEEDDGLSRSADPVLPQFELFDVGEFFNTIRRLVRKPASLEICISHFNCTLKAANVVEAVARAYERLIFGIDFSKPRSGYDTFLYGFRFGRKATSSAGEPGSVSSMTSPSSAKSPMRTPSVVDPLLFMQTDPGFRARFKIFSKVIRALKEGVEFVKRNIDEVSAEVTGSLKGMGEDCQVSGSFRDMDYHGPANVSLTIPPLFLGLYRVEFVELGNDKVGLQLDLMLPSIDSCSASSSKRSKVKTLVPFGRVMISEMHTEVLLDIDAMIAQHHHRSLSAASERTAPWSPSSSFARKVEAEKTNSMHTAFALSFNGRTDADDADAWDDAAASVRSPSSFIMMNLFGGASSGSTAFGKIKLSSSEFAQLHANAKTGSFKTRLLPILEHVLAGFVRPLVAKSFPQHQALFDSLQTSLLHRLCSPTTEIEFELLMKAFVLDKESLVLMVCGIPMHPTPMAFRDELPLLDVILQLDDLVNMWIDDRYPPYANPMYF